MSPHSAGVRGPQPHRLPRRSASASGYDPLRTFHAVKTRAQLQQEFLASRDEVRALDAEDSGSAWLARRNAQPQVRLAGEPKRGE